MHFTGMKYLPQKIISTQAIFTYSNYVVYIQI